MLLYSKPLLLVLQLFHYLISLYCLVFLCPFCHLILDRPLRHCLIFLWPLCCFLLYPLYYLVFLCTLCHLFQCLFCCFILIYPLCCFVFLCPLRYLLLYPLHCLLLYLLCFFLLCSLHNLVLYSIQLQLILYLELLEYSNKPCQISFWAANQPAPAFQNLFIRFQFSACYLKKAIANGFLTWRL